MKQSYGYHDYTSSRDLKSVSLLTLFDDYCEYEPISLKVQKEQVFGPLTFNHSDRVLCWVAEIIVPEEENPDLAFLRIGDTLSFRLNENEWCENAGVCGRRYKDGICVLSITIFKSCIKDVVDVFL